MSGGVIKQILEWLRTMAANLLSKLTDLLPGRHPATPEKELARAIQNKQGRGVDTNRGGPNMPKYQPCDICNSGAKRVLKTSTAAKYHCSKCNNTMYVQAR